MNVKVIDLSGDLRLQNLEDYTKWYKHEPAPQQLINKAVYGLTEWNRDNIANAEWISNPGCYSTASLLGLAPVIIENLVSSNIDHYRCKIRYFRSRSKTIKNEYAC